MIITVNLLPKEEQLEFKEEILRRIITFGAIILSLVFVVFIVLGLAIYTDMEIQAGTEGEVLQKKLSGEQGKKTTEVEQMIQSFNKRIEQAAAIQNAFHDNVPLLAKISGLLPDGITLENLAIDYRTGAASLSGSAKERKDLEALRDILKNDSDFGNIDLPLASLLKQKDIEFSIAFTIKNK